MDRTIWITGASSGIGAELIRSVPAGSRAIGVSRRPSAAGEHFAADLAEPAAWDALTSSFEAVLEADPPQEAMLLHFSGAVGPLGPIAAADPAAYRACVMLNAAAGQVLGGAFIAACARRAIAATIVICSSPGARNPQLGLSAYGSGKAALEQWARAAALDQEDAAVPIKVFSVVPYGVDTEMVKEVMEAPDLPLGERFRAAAAEGKLASPASVAREVWELIFSDDVAAGDAIDVGAVPGKTGD
jgi:NAD(P)-dependent dehydrogenase (short-subunit alcohol dehydrogenase family)